MNDSETDPDIPEEETMQILPKINCGLPLDEAIDDHREELENLSRHVSMPTFSSPPEGQGSYSNE